MQTGKELNPRYFKLNERNQCPNARHYSSAKAKSGLFPPLGGIKRRGPFLGTFLGKQKGTMKNGYFFYPMQSLNPLRYYV